MRSRSILLLTGLLLVTEGSVLAQDAAQGRLPDGRAFRTDAEGNQLVDYIAELELNVADLNRRLVGLETEVEQKQQVIDRMQSGRAPQGELSERDLSGAGRSANVTHHSCDTQVAAVRQELLSARDDLDLLRTNHQREVSAYESALQKLRSQSQVAAVPNCGPEVARAEAAKSELYASSLRERDIALQQTEARYEDERRQWEKKLSDAEAELRSMKEESELLRTKFQEASRASAERAVLPLAAQNDSSPARQRAVDSLKGSVSQELHRVRDLLAIRERLIGQYARTKGPVEVRPSKAVSSRGRAHQDLLREMKSANSVVQLSYVQRDTQEIKRKLQDDIALLERMIRLYGQA